MRTGALGSVGDNPNSSFSRPFILTSISLILASGRFSVKVKEIAFATVVDDSLSAIMFRFEKNNVNKAHYRLGIASEKFLGIFLFLEISERNF